MDRVSSINRTPAIEALPIEVKNRKRGAQVSSASVAFSNSSRKSILQSQTLHKTFCTKKSIYARRTTQPLIVAVANTDTKPRGFKYSDSGVRTPLEPTSPEGIFLSAVLQNHIHLFPLAVSEQLDRLACAREDEAAEQEIPKTAMQSILHKRIAEIKERERRNVVEDVIYMCIVHQFSEFGVPLIPKLSESVTDKCRELESIHSLEVQELIREHVATVVRTRGKSFLVNSSTTTKIDRLDLGRIYAASVMFGYFLKSACFRRQMDIGLFGTQQELRPQSNEVFSVANSNINGFRSPVTLGRSTGTQLLELCRQAPKCGTKGQNLRSYVMGFDAETLQRCAKLKSQEAVNVIEKHTWALFGDDAENESELDITFPSLERLVLEAVSFGTFLWEVERSVDSTYTLRKN